MPSVPTPNWRRSRQPLACVAMAGIAGILLAEGVRRLLPGVDDGSPGWIADGLFLLLAAFCLARPSPWRFWAFVTTGYAALHFFNADPLPAAVLAHELAVPPSVHAVRAVGVVLDVPRVSASSTNEQTDAAPLASGGITRHFLLRLESVELDGRLRWESNATVAVEWRDGPRAVNEGDCLELTARAANVAPPRNPGEFDRVDFLRRHGVRSEIFLRGLADGHVTQTDSWFQPLSLARRMHDWMQGQLCLDLRDNPPVCAVVSTMMLGLRDHPGLGALEAMFQRTGTLHYFAIDGLKLGLLAFVLLRALEATGLPRPWSGLFILPLLLGYAMATGLGAASARAVIVAAVLVGGEWLDRPARPFNSLGAAAAFLLFCNTNQLFEIGFQLSFAVVLAILTLAKPINDWLRRWVGPGEIVPEDDPLPWPRRAFDFLRRQWCGLTAVAIAAWLGSLPLMLLDFHVVSPISPFANVAAFPLAFTVLALAVFSLAGAMVSRSWVLWMNNANWLFAKGLLLVVHVFDAVPGGSIAASSPDHWHWLKTPPELELTVLDVGHSRAACARADGANWLIDCARPYDYGESVRACLQARGVRRLDGLLLTQDDADHLGAVTSCREDFFPRRVVLPSTIPRAPLGRNLRRQLLADRTPMQLARHGDLIPLATGVEAQVLYPPDGIGGKGTAADRALALRFAMADWRVWWLTDGDGAAVHWLLANERPDTLGAAVLVTSGPISEEFLRAVQPRLVILRPTRDEENGGPLPSGVPRMTQVESGAVTLEFYHDRIEACGFVDGKKLTIRK